MKTLKIKEKYHTVLKHRATDNKRSIQAELEEILREALEVDE
jgi:plasmid stability protein